jgi:hypothetical protein
VKRFAKVLGFVLLSLLSALAGFVAALASMVTSGLTVPLAAALTYGAVRSLQAAAHVPPASKAKDAPSPRRWDR